MTKGIEPISEAVLREGELYTLEELQKRLGLSPNSYRKLRDAGMPEIIKGKRKYFSGRHVIAWFEQLDGE